MGLDPAWRTVSVAAATVASDCLSFAPVEGKAARSSVRRHGQVARSGDTVFGRLRSGSSAGRRCASVSGTSRLGPPLQAWLPLQALANQPGARPAAPRLGSVRARVRARVRVGHIAPRLGLLLTRALASHGQSVGIGRCVGCSGRCHSEDSHPCRRPSPGPALQTVRWPTPRSRGRPRDRPRGRRCGGRALANPPGSSLAAPSDWPRLARARPPHRQPRGRSRARWQWLGAQWSGLALGAPGCPQPPGAP